MSCATCSSTRQTYGLPCVGSGTYGKEFFKKINKNIIKKIFAVSQIVAHSKDMILKKRKHSLRPCAPLLSKKIKKSLSRIATPLSSLATPLSSRKAVLALPCLLAAPPRPPLPKPRPPLPCSQRRLALVCRSRARPCWSRARLGSPEPRPHQTAGATPTPDRRSHTRRIRYSSSRVCRVPTLTHGKH